MVDTSIFRDSSLRSLLTDEEMTQLKNRFRSEVIDDLDEVIRSWDEDWSVEDKGSHFEDLKSSLEKYLRFTDEVDDEDKVRTGIKRIDNLIKEIEEYEEQTPARHASPTAPVSPSTSHLVAIFDDIDE